MFQDILTYKIVYAEWAIYFIYVYYLERKISILEPLMENY
jgi:hypothetical protein